MEARYPIKTILLSGDNFEVCRLLNEDSSLTLQFNGDQTACMVALYERWQQEERVSFKLALKSNVSGEDLRAMQKFEALPDHKQWGELIKTIDAG
jgi:hypothetical protein